VSQYAGTVALAIAQWRRVRDVSTGRRGWRRGRRRVARHPRVNPAWQSRVVNV